MTATVQNTLRLALAAASIALVWALTIVFPAAWPRGLIVQGAAFGAASGLLAVGLVLTYQTTRVINFSYGAMGACAAQVGVVAYQRHELPWAVSVTVAIVVGAGLGLAVDLVFRRFGSAPRIIVTVATIGLVQVFVGLQFAVAFWSGATVPTPQFSTGLSEDQYRVGTTVFTNNDLVAAALVPVALVGLSWFLLRTPSGTAVRALADNRERALLLGIPVRRLSRLTWLLVGALAAAVLVLNAPMNGIPASPFVAAGGVFLPALAAAVVAKMERLTTAFALGVALGVLNAVVSNNVHKTALGTVAMLVVVLAALLLRRWDGGRGAGDDAAWLLPASSRSLPPEVASLPAVRWGRGLVLAALAVVAVGFPLVVGPARVHTVTGDVVLGIAVLSLVVLAGWSGTISLGQYAIVGVGAVVAGNVMVRYNLDLFVVLVLAAVGGAAVSLLVGLPALRVRPLFLAVTTFAFAAAMDQYFLDPSNHPELIPATVTRPILWERFPLESENSTYYLSVGALAVVAVVAGLLRRSRPGRVLLASRDNERAAGAMTVAVTRVRLGGMAVAGMIAGVAGALTVVLEGGVGASSFPAQTSVLVFSIAVVGGLSSISGALLGVVAVELLAFGIGETTSQPAQFATLGTGVLLVGILLVVPGGLGQAVDRLRHAFAGRVARRYGIGEVAVGDAAASPAPAAEPTWMGRRRQGLLSCRAVTASYGPLQVLFGVDLEVAEGEMVALLGTNGAGKSTLFRTVTALLAPTSGDIRFDGDSLRGRSTDAIARLGLSVMPADRGVFPSLSVADNLRVACWQRRRTTAGHRDLDEVLGMFPILRERSSQVAGSLSGGEQQQLSLAMAFVTRPKLLLIDELSLGLAPTVVAMLCEKVRQIHAAGTTVVLVEQSVAVALQLAERAVFVDKGAIRFEGRTADLVARPDLLRSVFIGGVGPDDMLAMAEGARQHPAPVTALRHRTDLVCDGLVKRFGGLTALDEIDLRVSPGHIVGLVGHNGAGKTTLFDVISGFERPSRGRVLLGGRDITRLAPHRRAVRGLGRSFQEARLYPSLSVAETIVVALDQHLEARGWVAAGLGLPASLDAEAHAFRRADEVIELLGLGRYASTPISGLSTGTRRIVELACVLAMDPAVVLLDEPSAGVAQKDTEALAPLLRRVTTETGSAILIVEHDIALLSSLCDQFVALELGRVICSGAPQDVLSHPRVIESYLGTSDAAAPQAQGPVGVVPGSQQDLYRQENR